MRITKSTADAVVARLYPNTSDLLKRFEQVKQEANLADGERDKLRQYIQDNVPAGQYDNVLMTIETGAEQCYVNAEGKDALRYNCIVDGRQPEAGIEVVVLRDAISVEALLHQLQTSKEALAEYLQSLVLCKGLTVDNDSLYSEKASRKIKIVILPEV